MRTSRIRVVRDGRWLLRMAVIAAVAWESFPGAESDGARAIATAIDRFSRAVATPQMLGSV